jgi:hypothetical protein
MLFAMLGDADKASAAAKDYLEIAFPTSKEHLDDIRRRKAAETEAFQTSGPIKLVNGKLAMA